MKKESIERRIKRQKIIKITKRKEKKEREWESELITEIYELIKRRNIK
jgi:hypothetical protein